MKIMKRLLVGVSLVALSAGAAMAAPAVVESGVNLRSGPGTEYAVIETMPAGARVEAAGCRGGWCRVDYHGAVGYASRAYLEIETAYYSPYDYSYNYYYPAYEYYEPYEYAFGVPYVGFGTGFVGHRHEHELAERHELGERGFGSATAPEVGRAHFARSFAAYRGGAPEAHLQAGRIGGTAGQGQAISGGFGRHMAAVGQVGEAGIGRGVGGHR